MRLRTPDGEPANPALSRRAALSLFTAGYAAALSPPALSAVSTDADGLEISEPTFAAPGGHAMPAYMARPQGAGPFPAVIVVNEIFGIHAYIKDVCRRLAKQGYIAIAPDYFDRAGDPATLSSFEDILPVVNATPLPQVMDDTQAALAFLQAQPFAAKGKTAITGFCGGGSVGWLAAARFPQIKAGAAWYGRLTPRGEGALSPLSQAAALKAPVLGLYAENDDGIPLSSVEAMRAALANVGNPTGSEIIVYPGTEHGFHADYRPSFNAAAAQDGWARMLAWFAKAGIA